MLAFQRRNILNADRIDEARRHGTRNADQLILSGVDTGYGRARDNEVRLADRGQMYPLGNSISFFDSGFAEQRRRIVRKIGEKSAAVQDNRLGSAIFSVR